jgi:3-dehydroquinate dehydratase/shikimate dehydrogenase
LLRPRAERANLVATLTGPPAEGELESLPAGVDWLEVRADLTGELDAGELRRRFPGHLLYTLRSVGEGGAFAGGAAERAARLRAAVAGGYDRIDLELDRDLDAALLADVPAEQRVVSWHGPAISLDALEETLTRASTVPAALYKLVMQATQPAESLRPLELLFNARRDDVVAFALGPLGAWTRLVAPYLGAPWIYGSAGDAAAAPGQLPVRRLVADYGLPLLRPLAALCGLVGKPALHSLSPRLHNGAYRNLDLPLLYVPFEPDALGDFWLEVVEDGALEELGLPLRGLSVTTPFKAAAVAVAGVLSPLAERLTAVNTLVRRDGVWEGENTDCEGVVLALGWHGVHLPGRRAVVVGAGRAGRATAFALAAAGAEVTLANRGEEAGRAAAEDLALPFVPLAELELRGREVVVHATSLGRGAADPLPFDPTGLEESAVLVDLVYGEGPTPLAAAAQARGVHVVDGREVLLGQAVSQFRLMTGRDLPLEAARATLGLREHAVRSPRS